MKCLICEKETGSEIKKTCSDKCRSKLSRNKNYKKCVTIAKTVTDEGGIVTKNIKTVTEEVRKYDTVSSSKSKKCDTEGVLSSWCEEVKGYDLNIFGENSRKRDSWVPTQISKLRPELIDEEWRNETRAYKQLMYNLEHMSVEELEAEHYWIPAWKYTGYKTKPNINEILKNANSK